MKRFIPLIIAGLLLLSVVSTSCAQQTTKIRVATDADYPPFTYQDEQSKKIIGFDIDLIEAIAKKENFEIELINAGFESVLNSMAQGQYDLAISAISITEQRKKDMLFSEPYFVAGRVVTARKNDTSITGKDSLTGKVVGAEAGSTSALYISEMKGITPKIYKSFTSAFEDLINGTIDAIVSDNTIALYYVNKNPTMLKVAGEPFTQENYGIAVNKNKPELLAKINAGLSAVKSQGLIEELSKKWLAASSNAKDTVITLERTACKGRCPVYKLTIYGSGTIVYEGKEFVKTTGKAESTISQEQIKQLVSEFEKVNYYSLKDSYVEVTITDFPYVTTSITTAGKTKTIRHYSGDLTAPKPLTELENKIDELVNSAQWIK